VVARALPLRPAVNPAAQPALVRTHTRYYAARLGTRPGTGDLQVFAPLTDTMVHVYLGQQLVSRDGDGQARIENLKPAKYPVMIWAPSRMLRKVYWVSIRPGELAALEPAL
jgi:hypothetical protein